jgi:hypothetical protein
MRTIKAVELTMIWGEKSLLTLIWMNSLRK